jgi:hypothetical protein
MYTEKSYSILKHLAKGKNKKGQEMRTKNTTKHKKLA